MPIQRRSVEIVGGADAKADPASMNAERRRMDVARSLTAIGPLSP